MSDQVRQNRFATSARPHNANLQIAIRHSSRRQKRELIRRSLTTKMDDDSASCISATELLDAYLERQLTQSDDRTSSTRIDVHSDADHEKWSSSGASCRTACYNPHPVDWKSEADSRNVLIDHDQGIEDDIDRFRRRLQASQSSISPTDRLSAESDELLQNLQMLKDKCRRILSTDHSLNQRHKAQLEEKKSHYFNDQDREIGPSEVQILDRRFTEQQRLNRIRDGILHRSSSHLDRFLDDDVTGRSTFDSLPANVMIDETRDRLTAEDIRNLYPSLFSTN